MKPWTRTKVVLETVVLVSGLWAAAPVPGEGQQPEARRAVGEASTAPQVAAIRARREAFNDAIAARDAEAIGDFLTDAYHIVTSQNGQLHGRDESVRLWKGAFAGDPDVTYVRTTREIKVFGAWRAAEELGDWEGRRRVRGAVVRVAGRYAAKWVLEGEAWRLLSETFTALECEGPAEACSAP